MSLAYWKREKNFRAQEKGYVRDPEGFPIQFLFNRLNDEVKELEEKIQGYYSQDYSTIGEDQRLAIIKECADVSNIIDYIHAKAEGHIQNKYKPLEDSG